MNASSFNVVGCLDQILQRGVEKTPPHQFFTGTDVLVVKKPKFRKQDIQFSYFISIAIPTVKLI